MDDYETPMTVNIYNNRDKEIIELFTKPVTRHSVHEPPRFRGQGKPEPSLDTHEEFITAYWCPALALIRLATIRYSRPDKWGPVISTGVPENDFLNVSGNRYKVIVMALAAVEEAERDNPGGFIPGHYSATAAWAEYVTRPPEPERDPDEIPF